MKRLLSFFLALVMSLSILPIYAADENVPVVLTQESTTFNVSLPTGIPVDVDANGVVTVSTDNKIINNSIGPIEVSSVTVVPEDQWVLVDFNTNFSELPVDIKQFGFQMNGIDVKTDGTANAQSFGVINGGTSKSFTYDANVATQTTVYNDTEIANVLFVVGWYGNDSQSILKLNDLVGSEDDDSDYLMSDSFCVQITPDSVGADEDTVWSSSDTDVLTVTQDGLVQPVNPGIADVEFEVADEAASITLEVTGDLNDYTWQQISDVAAAGLGDAYFDVGDTKQISLNGTIGRTSYNNQSVDVMIIGFDHNAELENSQDTITFLFVNPLKDSIHSPTGLHCSAPGFLYNNVYSSAGGWASSYIRNTLLSETINAIDDDLALVISETSKWTDNVGRANNLNTSISETEEYLFLLSEYEIFGLRTWVNPFEQDYQKQYTYFANGGATVAYDVNGVATWYHLRSPSGNPSYPDCNGSIMAGGGMTVSWVDSSGGLRPAFNVG